MAPGAKNAAASVGGISLSSSNSGAQLAILAAAVVVTVQVRCPQDIGELTGSLSVSGLRFQPAAGAVAALEASPRSPDGNTALLGRKGGPVRHSGTGAPELPILAQNQQPQGPVHRPAGGIAVEEVFENERWQPFRGWGHTWPGHFLPTDPVRHWCDANAQAREGSNRHRGMAFEDAAPPLPDDWVW